MEKRVWVIHMGRLRFEAELEGQVNRGFVAIGWSQLDLEELDTREKIIEVLHRLGTVKPGAIPVYATMLYRFGYDMQKNELIVLPISGSTKVKIGRVDDTKVQRDEKFDEEYVHIRRIKWLKEVERTAFSQPARYSMGSFSSVSLGSSQVYDEATALIEGQTIQKGSEIDERDEDPLLNIGEVLSERLDEFISARLEENLGHQYAHIVAGVLRAMGYVTEIAPPGKDSKRDIMAYPDDLQLRDPMIRVEVKSSKNPIGVEDVRALNGALKGTERGLFVARGGYSKDARDFARDLPHLTLLDGEEIVQLILKYYEKLDQDTQNLIPLKKVWIPRI